MLSLGRVGSRFLLTTALIVSFGPMFQGESVTRHLILSEGIEISEVTDKRHALRFL